MQMIIKWDPEKMATGVPEVDAQHQEWIRRYNEFNEAVNQGKGIETVRSTLDFFVDYADTHFKCEEACMAERNCPAAEANRVAHQQMRYILVGFQACVGRKEVSMVEVASLRIQMQKWLVNHILTIDIQLRDCQVSGGQSGTELGVEFAAAVGTVEHHTSGGRSVGWAGGLILAGSTKLINSARWVAARFDLR
jgi:hemerythrin